jgi:hypothetical protein
MTSRRLITYISGSVVAIVAAAALAAGGVALWADGKKNDDGYVTSASHSFTSGGYAIATDDLDIDENGAPGLIGSDAYGHVRVKADSRSGRPVFVGVARTADVERYLSASAHSSVTDVELDPFHAEYRSYAGAHRPAPPAGAGIWAASAHGSGPQTMTWKVRSGGWSVVVMNADGSRGVDAGVSVGADVPFLGPLAWGLFGGGLLLALLASGLIVVGVRSPGNGGTSQPAQAHQPAAA